jgi:hypothetical protein
MQSGMTAGVGLVATEPGQPTMRKEISPSGGAIMRGSLRVEARDKDGKLIGVHCKDDLTTKQLAQLIMLGVLASNQTIKDTSNTTHNETTSATTGSSPAINAGTGSTAAAFTDYNLQSQSASTSGTEAATVGSISSNTFTVTATITNGSGSTITYAEVGIQVTVNSHVYLITHDVFSGLAVSNGGTLAVTYTFTFT